MKKPAVAERTFIGKPNKATTIPAISSITISLGSFLFNIISAWPAIGIEDKTRKRIKNSERSGSIFDRKNQMKRPGIEPNVPGAKGIFPT